MGVVYLARERDLGDRPCAIKILHVQPGTPPVAMAEAVARLKREASTLGSLGSHPNLVTVYTAGQDDHGLAYIVMEFVEGETLKVKFELGTPFTAVQAARIVRQIAGGLAHAHAQGIVHRDLKPGNLILTPASASNSWVKIVDFGIAKPGDGEGLDLTMPRHVLGTPRYMSPEQRAGRSLDARSDIYSLALIAAELLSDERIEVDLGPFAEVPADLTSWPDALKRVLERGLEPDPADRFSSALEFADAFEAAVDGWELDDDPLVAPPVAGRPMVPASATIRAAGEVEAPAPVAPASGERDRGPVARRRWLGGSVVAAVAVATWATVTFLPGLRAGGAERGSGSLPAETLASAVRVDTLGDAPPGTVAGMEVSRPAEEGPDPEAARPVSAPPAAATQAPVPEAPPSADHGAAVADLRSRVDPTDPDTTGLGVVVRQATRLISETGIPDTLVVEVRYLRAEARLMLGEGAGACADLEVIREAGDTSPWVAARYARAVAALLALNCSGEGLKP